MELEKKNQVLALLGDTEIKPSEQFNQLFEQFRKTEGRSIVQEKHLNRVGFNKTTLNTVIYELRKLHKISDSDIRKVKLGELPVKMEVVKNDPPALGERIRNAIFSLEETIRLKILIILKFMDEIDLDGIEVSEELKSFLSELSAFDLLIEKFPELQAEINEQLYDYDYSRFLQKDFSEIDYPEELKAEIEALKLSNPRINKQDVQAIEETIEVFKAAPAEVKQEIRFRDEFPFINDPELPSELKVLVTDKFNHYFGFCDAHRELFARAVLHLTEGVAQEGTVTISNLEIFELAKKAVDNFEVDQLIYDEFVHYRDNKKILGKHPIFKQRKLQESVDNMSVAAAAKRATNLENYIRRDTVNADNAKTPEAKTKFTEKVVEWKTELVLVNLKLGAKDGGK